jgi:adenosylmethionine-8-amino-7-oxononanoate aminotransferase
MNTEDYRRKDKASLWHPYTAKSSADDGLPIIVHGDGVYLFDSDGKRYVHG